MDRALYQKIENHMLEMAGDTAHDSEHIYRVLYAALDIAAHEQGIDYDVLVAACLLHDIGREAQFQNPQLCHAREGAEMARAFLLGLGLAEEYADRVSACVRTHRYRGGDKPASLEAKILFDADKLDVTGAMAIARTLLYSGHENLPLYGVGPDGAVLDGTAPEHGDNYMREYHIKLQGLYDEFYTARATEIAKERKPLFDAFYFALLAQARFGRSEGKIMLDKILENRD